MHRYRSAIGAGRAKGEDDGQMKQERSEYKTRQKELIMEFLQSSGDVHITIDQVADYLRGQGNSVGRTTIYRYLEKLASQGTLRKYFIEEGMGACYQYVADSSRCAQHFHLKCTRCGRLFHVECEELEALDGHLLEHHGFQVDHTKTVLYGLCEECRRG